MSRSNNLQFAGPFNPYPSNPTSKTTFSGLGDFTTSFIFCAGFPLLIIDVQLLNATGAPNGVLSLLGCDDPETAPNNLPIVGFNNVFPVAPTVGIYGLWPNIAGVAGVATCVIKNPARCMAVQYTRGGGGAAGQFTANYQLKGAAG